MDPITQQQALATAGAGGDPVYVDDVFSTFLYDGTSANHTITNGIDLSGEGGMVWIKSRSTSTRPGIFDTERGAGKFIYTSETTTEQTDTTELSSFNSNGFSLGDNSGGFGVCNTSSQTYCAWTFRKCPGFFDVVTYTGNGTAGRQIAHNLGSVPGMIVIKSLTSTENWTVWHRNLTSNQYVIQLNTTSAEIQAGNGPWNNTGPTSSVFTLGGDFNVNQNNQNYVAYIFAHDDQSFGDDGDEAIIKCGSYTGNDNSDGPNVNLGFEPQWLLVKAADSAASWTLIDSMRGFTVNGVNDARLFPNTSAAESSFNVVEPNATGFKINTTLSAFNTNNEEYIYIAIRRPHKPPEAGTDVFDMRSHTSDVSGVLTSTTITADMAISLAPDSSTASNTLTTRLLEKYLRTEGTDAANSGTHWAYDEQTGIRHTDWFGAQNILDYTFKRAPGFFDVVTYTGNGVQGRNITHNLGVAPDLMIVKNRDTTNDNWHVYVSGITHLSVYGSDPDSYGNNPARLYLNTTDNAEFSSSGVWDHTHPTATTFRVGDTGGTNGNGEDLIAYLFATLAGISKVGSYAGTGSDINIDCGFTSGARLVLIKRTDSTSDWYVWDSTRGIVGGNDPYLLLNSTAAEVTNTDYIDPLNSGFTVTSSAPAALNASGGSYIFFAIA